ncbi:MULTISPECIES: isochorismatase family cysteine hydrolase [Thermocrispum]|jgi:nicotinamidase-related amidase|uniref:Cysteine hydrolase n=1 Tax=Thermocrispum agreste TaxID=37925 RepID=A0A2W4JE28_9PSEU|nr:MULTISPECIES: isochorismatase family cysteine hydrolase [Thermocrispum]PZM97404.1 MAG: cysteine hydrolase [Thermocrispum agreste]
MSKTALLLVDVINDFFDPDGPNYYPRVRDTVEPLTELLTTARAAGAVVVHAVERHRRNVPDAEQPKLPVHCLDGSFEADFFPGFQPAERPGELVVPKRRYSGFFATDLALTLHEQRVERIVVAGVKTNVCIRATCQDGFAHGFAVVVPREATNSNRQHLEEASLEDIQRYFGSVVPTAEAVAMLKEHP